MGSTNFDNGPFGTKDAVNLVIRDGTVVMSLGRDMESDLRESKRISLDEWRHRPVTERATELLGWVFEQQQ